MAQPPDFPLFLTDGDDTHLPNEAERQQDYKTTDDYGLSQKALSNFAIEMMRKLDRKADKGITYTKIPSGYSVWPCQRGGHNTNAEKPKIDWYIFGHPRHKKFDSFAQFAVHINFLQLQLQPGNCTCKVCLKHPLTAQDIVVQDPVPATMVTLTGDQAAPEKAERKKDKPQRAPKAQTEAGPSTQKATPISRRQKSTQSGGAEEHTYSVASSSTSKAFPTERRLRPKVQKQPDDDVTMQSDEEEEDGSLAASSSSKSLPDKRHPKSALKLQRADVMAISGEDSDAIVSAADFDSEDHDSDYKEDGGRKPKEAKQPPKRALSSKAAGKQPIRRVRFQSDDDRHDGEDDDRMDVDHEEEDHRIEGAEVEDLDFDSLDDSDVEEIEDFVPDQEVLHQQELFALVKKMYDQQVFTRVKEEDRSFHEPLKQVVDTNFNAREWLVHEMLTELPQQGSWVPRIGEIVVYISDAKTEFRQARIVTDSTFWLINPENRQLLGRPEWRAGVIAQVPDHVVTPKMLREKYGEEILPLHLSGYLIEPFPDVFSPKKDTELASLYVPIRNICPFTYAIELHKGRPTQSYHGSMFCAMERMATFSLVYQQYIRAKWPDCLIYYGGIYLGAELLVVGDAVRIKSEFIEKGCYEILIINSIKLKVNNIQAEPDGKTVTGESAGLRRLYFRGCGYTTNRYHPYVGGLVSFTEEVNIHPAMRQQQRSLKWYRIGDPGEDMEVDFSRVIGRLFESSVVMKWFPKLWFLNMEEEAINHGHEGVVEMRQLARMKSANLGWDPDDNKGLNPRWFWARDRVHALDLIYHSRRQAGEADPMGRLANHTYYFNSFASRHPVSWRSIVMKVDRDNAIDYPGNEKVDQPREFIGPNPVEPVAKYPASRNDSAVTGETYDRFTKSTKSIMMNKEGRLARRKAAQDWWNAVYFIYQ